MRRNPSRSDGNENHFRSSSLQPSHCTDWHAPKHKQHNYYSLFMLYVLNESNTKVPKYSRESVQLFSSLFWFAIFHKGISNSAALLWGRLLRTHYYDSKVDGLSKLVSWNITGLQITRIRHELAIQIYFNLIQVNHKLSEMILCLSFGAR
jgi:hypothetical protein